MKLIPHNGINRALFKEAATLIRPCNVLLDVGCGLRPQNMVECNRHVCLEPHGEYADALEASGYEVVRKRAQDGLVACDTVIALDVIEHMERADGEAFVKDAMEKARGQVVIFTPLGFMPQHGGDEVDPWGCQGQTWQLHRSGWHPKDFPDWKIVSAENFHQGGYGAFFAIWG